QGDASGGRVRRPGPHPRHHHRAGRLLLRRHRVARPRTGRHDRGLRAAPGAGEVGTERRRTEVRSALRTADHSSVRATTIGKLLYLSLDPTAAVDASSGAVTVIVAVAAGPR